MTGLPGEPRSYWLQDAPSSDHPVLGGDREVDVAVLGAGISGLSLALELVEEGLEVALVEAGRVAGGASGYSTAKISSLHGLTYAQLESRQGEEIARAYGAANEAGLAAIAARVQALQIDCDFSRRDNFTYAPGTEDVDSVQREVDVAQRLGLPASYVTSTELPFPVAAAVRFSEQAQFNPVRYLRALAARFVELGGQLFERTAATAVDDGKPCVVKTRTGATLRADRVVVATHFPFLDRGLYFARMHPERSYVLAARVRGEVPQGMYLSTESPVHSIRQLPTRDGELLMVGGESHKTGQADTAERYRRLGAWASTTFEVESFEYRWATQDALPVDGVPMIGRLVPYSSRVLVATGYRKWGFAAGAAAGRILTDAILERENPWAFAFDPSRIRPRASTASFVKENANVGWRFFADRLTKRAAGDSPAPGEGAVVGRGLSQRAVCRSEDGELHTLSARCTHLGCIVNWNSAEHTWDCPCHGSRFAADGSVIEGPAVDPLPTRPQG
jgi:glycine/D-amino acid oxidase-like deaminating enzyme/nitrite reductase/ring-hydroxylating ferredoxin subunit